MRDQSDGLAAYVQFSLSNTEVSKAVSSEIAQVEHQIAALQTALAHERAAAVLRDDGLLFAWARVRVDAHYELATLIKQPWFESLTCHPAGGLRLTVQLSEGSRLVLQLMPAGWPAVQIEKPAALRKSDANTALFGAALAGLAAEGRLTDVVTACAQRLGLTLAAQTKDMPQLGFASTNRSDSRPPELDVSVGRQYFQQRAVWLAADGSSLPAQAVDTEATVRQLVALHRRLFVLDEQRRTILSQETNPEYIKRLAQEYEVLIATPHLCSLTFRAKQVELCTDTIQVQGVSVGQFTINCDFAARRVQMANQTNPVFVGSVRYDHPHVREGVPCLGNISEAVADLLARFDLPKLTSLTISFLESYYPSGRPHRPLSDWARGDDTH
jgi:hypothetical protein